MNEKQPDIKLGRPKKRERVVSEVADAMGIQLAADVLSLEDMEGFPDIAREKPRNQAIMAMVACGFPQTHIAESFKVSQPTINEIIKRIDPNGRFKIDPKAKKAIITKLAEGRALSAINSITLDDLMVLDADKRTNVAQKMLKISQDLNQTKHKGLSGSRMDSLLAAIEEERESVEDAEFEEIER
jgi:hypothetical protein